MILSIVLLVAGAALIRFAFREFEKSHYDPGKVAFITYLGVLLASAGMFGFVIGIFLFIL